MMVLINEACPGQSTNVNCTPEYFALTLASTSGGKSAVNEEKPKSKVMPRAALCGCLSKLAVLNTLDSALARDVLPLSMCPKIPTLMFSIGSADMIN